MENLTGKLISFLLSPPAANWLLILKIFFFGFFLLLLVFIVIALFRSGWLKFIILQDATEFFTYRPFGLRKIVRAWNRIKGRLETGLESEYKLAVIEADSMLDDILKRMGFAGETLAERLKNLTAATLSNIEEIKEAHQIRNNIIHDPDYRLSLDEAKKVLAIYQRAFEDLQAF